MFGDNFDSLQAEAVRLVVGRHIFEAIAIDTPAVEALIDIVHDRNFMCLVAVVLR